ncbi:C6 transcription factor [Rhodotorula toruloides]|uniref:C6 transcription factor n=1 Tax=Rhodotorula toruloides TaxID=5286 RepID=A0A511KIU6_RHOTO|nr:C6 transcription factor [Rhodotorula toruloides]
MGRANYPPKMMPSARHLSCEGCRKRKLKCSRTAPCVGCTLRGADCVWLDCKPGQGETTASLEENLAEIERLNRVVHQLQALLIERDGRPYYPPIAPPTPPYFDSLAYSHDPTLALPPPPVLHEAPVMHYVPQSSQGVWISAYPSPAFDQHAPSYTLACADLAVNVTPYDSRPPYLASSRPPIHGPPEAWRMSEHHRSFTSPAAFPTLARLAQERPAGSLEPSATAVPTPQQDLSTSLPSLDVDLPPTSVPTLSALLVPDYLDPIFTLEEGTAPRQLLHQAAADEEVAWQEMVDLPVEQA